MAISEKFRKTRDQFLSILIDALFLAAWLAVQYLAKWLLAEITGQVGVKYVLEHEEHWLFLFALRLASWTTFATVCIFLLTDFVQLILYALDETCTLAKEIRAKFRR